MKKLLRGIRRSLWRRQRHRPVIIARATVLAFLMTSALHAAAPPPAIPRAFGPHANPSLNDFTGATSFSATQRIVGTYFFYWYDVDSKEHILDGDGTDAL